MASILFLRRVLGLDALSCVAMGALMSLAPAPLARLLGLPADLLFGAGLLLLPVAAFIGWVASRPAPPPLLVWLVILGNLGWAAESFIVIGQAQATITSLGIGFVAAQALAVLMLTALEYVGVRRISRVAMA